MSDKKPESPQRLRSALDRVLVHDIKNMGFRLQMLLSNIDEHYDDPRFKKSVEELLDRALELGVVVVLVDVRQEHLQAESHVLDVVDEHAVEARAKAVRLRRLSAHER